MSVNCWRPVPTCAILPPPSRTGQPTIRRPARCPGLNNSGRRTGRLFWKRPGRNRAGARKRSPSFTGIPGIRFRPTPGGGGGGTVPTPLKTWPRSSSCPCSNGNGWQGSNVPEGHINRGVTSSHYIFRYEHGQGTTMARPVRVQRPEGGYQRQQRLVKAA